VKRCARHFEEGGDWIKRDLESANRGVIQAMFQRGVEVGGPCTPSCFTYTVTCYRP